MGHGEGHKGNKNVLHGLEEDLVCDLPIVLEDALPSTVCQV